MQKIISFVLLLCLLSVGVAAEVFELPGCQGKVKVGINALDTLGVYSPDCDRVSERILSCDCNNSINLYDKEHNAVYDFHIDYFDSGVLKNKEFYNVTLYKTYVDLTNLNVIIYFVIGLLIVPVLLIVFVLMISKFMIGGKSE